MAQLPVELVDEIVDYLHADRSSLKACSLTAQIFVRRTRHHLFKSVTVSYDWQTNANSFLSICSTSPYVMNSVRQLHIRDYVVCGTDLVSDSLFPSLKGVSLESTNFHYLKDTRPLFLSRLSFSSLSIATGMFQSAMNLCYCLGGLTEGGHLEIINCDISPSASYAAYFDYTCMRYHVPLRRLDFVASDPRIFKMLSRCRGALDHLESAHVYLGKGRDFDVLYTLLSDNDTRGSLTDLDLHLSQNLCNDKWLVTVNLNSLLNIGRLRKITIHIWGIGTANIPVLRWFLASFRACPCPNQLEAVAFVVNLPKGTRPLVAQSYAFWNVLSAVLSGPQFEDHLRSVEVILVVPNNIRSRSPLQRYLPNIMTWDSNLLGEIKNNIERQLDGRRRIYSVRMDDIQLEDPYD